MSIDPAERLRLDRARERFHNLLSSASPEHEWQSLFTEHPDILSSALPLRIAPREIVPLARPGRAEPDFLFYQKRADKLSACGVIELKRPNSRILTSPRKRQIILSREAATAVRQAELYADQHLTLPDEVLFLGTIRHLFVIMGLTSELANRIAREALRGLLPVNCTIIPYDEVLRRFEARLPQQVTVLLPLRSRGKLIPVGQGQLLVPSEYPHRDPPISEVSGKLGAGAFFSVVQGVLTNLDVDNYDSGFWHGPDRNYSREWRLDFRRRSYVLTTTNECSEAADDPEQPSRESVECRLHSLDNDPRWQLLFRFWGEDSNYRDDYYGLWHPRSHCRATVFEDDEVATSLFEGVRRENRTLGS